MNILMYPDIKTNVDSLKNTQTYPDEVAKKVIQILNIQEQSICVEIDHMND